MIRRLAATTLLTLFGLYVTGVAALFLFQRELIYDPSQNAPSPAEAGFDGATEHELTAADGTRILLWHSPAEPGAATVLYFQGKGGEISDRPNRWAAYRAAGLGVAFLSYRGYGGSAGSPTEAGLHQDADAAYDWLLAQKIPPDQIVIVGESLGTGVAIRLAADRDAGALIVEDPYTSLADVAAQRFPWLPARLLIRDPFPSLDRIARVTEPILIVSGCHDDCILARMGLDLFNAASRPRIYAPFRVPEADKLDLLGTDLWAEELLFIAERFPR